MNTPTALPRQKTVEGLFCAELNAILVRREGEWAQCNRKTDHIGPAEGGSALSAVSSACQGTLFLIMLAATCCLLTPGLPPQIPVVTLIQLLVSAEILHKPFHAEATIRLAVKHGNGAHSLIVVMLVQLHLDLRPALLADGYNGAGL